MYEIMATMLILFKAITDCILALKRDDIKGVRKVLENDQMIFFLYNL